MKKTEKSLKDSNGNSMKKINLIISVALLSSLCIQAQSRKDGYVDKTIRQQADYAGVEAKANEAMWDFSDTELAGEDYRLTYFLWADSTGTQALCSEKGTRTGYVLRGDTLTVTGYRNAVTRMDYDEGEAWLHYPMTVGSALTGTFHGRGTYCDKLAMRSYGQYTTKADRMGTMLLPEGDTLRNVLHLRTERVSAARYYPIDQRDSLRPATTDSLRLWLATDTATTRTVVDRWYAPACQYPVLETRALYRGTDTSPCFTQALYYPPSVQEAQQQSAVSQTMEERLFVAGDRIGGDNATASGGMDGKGNSAADGMDGSRIIKNVSISTSGQTVTVGYELAQDATVKAMVCNVSGMTLRQASQGGQSDGSNMMIVNCSGLRHGQYVLYLNVNGQVTSYTINL